MSKLTYQQKLDALSYRFYQGAQWEPKAGDYYTTSRADLELYQVVSIDNGIVRTRFTEGSDAIAEWPEDGFLTDGFGPRRVFVPEWVMNAPVLPSAETARAEAAEAEAKRLREDEDWYASRAAEERAAGRKQNAISYESFGRASADYWQRQCQYLLDVLDSQGFAERDMAEEDEAAISGIRARLSSSADLEAAR